MKVPTYTQQVQRTTEVGGQRMSVQASPGQFARGAEAAMRFYAQAEDAAFQYGKAELQQRNETERLKALNESNRQLDEAAAAAETIAVQNPDEADRYWQESVRQFRDANASTIQNDATRQQFMLQYDAASQKSTVQVQNYTRSVRLRQGTAEWIKTESDLINKASKGDVGAGLQLYGDPDQGIKGHYDLGIQNGFIAADKAASRSDTSRTLVAKQRLITHYEGLDTIEKLEDFSAALESGELPPDLSSELALMLPSEIKQLKGAIQTEIKSEKALQKAADALLSDEQRLEFEQFFNDPDISFDEKKKKLLNIVMTTPDQLGLTSDDFRAVQAFGRARVGELKSTVSAAATAIGKGQDSLMKLLTDGFDPGQDAILAVDKEIAALGAAAPESLVRDQLTLQRTYGTVNAMRQMGPVELERYVTEIEQSYEGQMTTEAATIIKNGRTMLTKLNSRISDGDALGAAQDRGIVKMPNLIPDMYERDQDGAVVVDNSGTPVISGQWSDAIATRKRAAYKVAQTFNLTRPQFLTKTEQQTYKERLKFGDTGTRMAILQSVVKGFGAEAPFVLGEIADSKEVGIYGHIGGLIIDGRNEAAEDALRGITQIGEGGPIDGLTPTYLNGEFMKTVGEAFYGMPKAEGSLFETAKAIYAGRAQGQPIFNPTMFADAIQAAAGRGKNGKGGIDSVNGAMTILPNNMDSADVEAALETITVEQLINPEISGQTISRELMQDINRSGSYRLMPSPNTGGYVVYRGDLRNETFQYVMDDNGDPLTINLSRWKELTGK
jgi:hypothetical protein